MFWNMFIIIISPFQEDRFDLESNFISAVKSMLVTDVVLFTLATGTKIQKMSPTWKFSHQHPQNVSNF